LLLTRIKRSVEQSLPGSPPMEAIEESRQVVKEVLEHIRTLSVNLHPSMLENVGLVPTLNWYHKEYTRRTGIVVHFSQIGEEREIAVRIKLTAYRIFQEALTNIARHADVKEAWVNININSNDIEMVIEDRGKGLNLSESSTPSSGIKGMHERALSVGGRTEVISSPGAGTRVEVFLPRELKEDKD
jgi:signal transduction histidine kinase